MAGTLVCGPWFGEVGLFVVWLAGCRAKAHAEDYERVIVIGLPGWDCLAADFATEYVAHPFEGIVPCGCVGKRNTQPSPAAIEACVFRNAADGDGYEWFPAVETHRVASHPGNLFLPPMGADAEFVRYGQRREEYEGVIAVHARWRQDWGSERNWPAERWDECVGALRQDGVGNRIVCIGKPDASLVVADASDRRGCDVAELCDILASAACVVGPSSGPMHLAALCGCPTVTWVGEEPRKREILRNRYLETYPRGWNPHNVPVACILREDWMPAAATVAQATRGLLDHVNPGGSTVGSAVAVGASPSPSAAASTNIAPPVGIGVICYKALGDAERCLRSIEAHTPEPHDLVVLDNSEGYQGIREFVAERYPAATYIRPSVQYGCWRGRNLIWQHCAMQGYGSFVVIDSDVVVTADDWLARMLAHMNSDPAIAVVGWSVANILGRDLGPNGEIVELPGMCQLHRTEAVADVNGWHRGYHPFHSGDTDFCLRLQTVGAHRELASRRWTCCVVPGECAIEHKHPHSGVRLCPDHDGVVARSMQLLADRTVELGLPVMDNIRHLIRA